MINLWRAKDAKVRIDRCGFNILKTVSYPRRTKSSIWKQKKKLSQQKLVNYYGRLIWDINKIKHIAHC